jgi:hypothetical protein
MNTQRKLMATIAAVMLLGMAGSALAAGERVWWKFDESSGTTASDSSGNNNAGTLTNMVGTEWTAGKSGNALSFDGVDDYVTRSALSANIAGECTISLWMKRNGNPLVNERLVCVGTSGGNGFNVFVAPSGYAGLDNEGGLTSELVSTGPSITNDAWHHIAATRSGTVPSTFKIYVDGVLKATDSNAANTLPALTRLRVGASFHPGSYYTGQIDDVRVYSRVLSGTEIQALSDSGQAAPVNIGGRLELFVDNYLIQTLSNATLRLHQPVDKGTVFSRDAPWEGNYCAYHSVVKDGNRFYFYGRGAHRIGIGGTTNTYATFAFNPVTSCRMSSDGINWELPSVGSRAFNGSTDNSIIWTNWGSSLGHGWSQSMEFVLNGNPNASAQERFIALAAGDGENDGVVEDARYATLVSPDGVNFTMRKVNCFVIPKLDCNGGIFWDSNIGQYATYTRIWYNPITGKTGGSGLSGGFRWVDRRLSTDLVNFSAPVLLSFRDASGNPAPAVDYY